MVQVSEGSGATQNHTTRATVVICSPVSFCVSNGHTRHVHGDVGRHIAVLSAVDENGRLAYSSPLRFYVILFMADHYRLRP